MGKVIKVRLLWVGLLKLGILVRLLWVRLLFMVT
jgi:hypothetical protein